MSVLVNFGKTVMQTQDMASITWRAANSIHINGSTLWYLESLAQSLTIINDTLNTMIARWTWHKLLTLWRSS